MKFIKLFLLFQIIIGCNSIPSGIYKSSCDIYHSPQLILILNEDKTFEYKRPYYDEKIIGTWEFNKKKELILKSKMFEMEGEFIPEYKFTYSQGNNDIYKQKGNKLLIYSKEGNFSLDNCYLIKIGEVSR